VHIGEGKQAQTLTTALEWGWFFTWADGNTNNPFTSCCAWWDNSTKTGHE
jgi:hypothetical protein